MNRIKDYSINSLIFNRIRKFRLILTKSVSCSFVKIFFCLSFSASLKWQPLGYSIGIFSRIFNIHRYMFKFGEISNGMAIFWVWQERVR